MKKFYVAFVLFAIALFTQYLVADFWVKVPEFNPAENRALHKVFLPPYYPIEEDKKYTVDDSGRRQKLSEEQSLKFYGKKLEKTEEIKYTLKKVNRDLTLNKVLATPDVTVLDFYGHLKFLNFDLPQMGGGGMRKGKARIAEMLASGIALEFGNGFPKIPGDSRPLYDAITIAYLAAYKYPYASLGGPSNWQGPLIANPRELAIYFVNEGLAIAKHSFLFMQNQPGNDQNINPGYLALKAISGQSWPLKSTKWVQWPINEWSKKENQIKQDFSSWQTMIDSLVLKDLIAHRVPKRQAFFRLRDVPEVSENVFERVINQRKATVVMKRNLASLLGNFTSSKSAYLLHKLTKDRDAITSVRAVQSLASHPHGKIDKIIETKLRNPAQDIYFDQAILLAGRSGNKKLASRLRSLYSQSKDDFRRELIVRSLMRLNDKQAKDIFLEALKNKESEQLSYSARLGLFSIGEMDSKDFLDVAKESFGKFDITEGTILSLAPKLRTDVIDLIISSGDVTLNQWLWKLIIGYKETGGLSENGGTAHIIAHALYEIPFEVKFVNQTEAVKKLNLIVTRSASAPQLRLAALTRLYELDSKKAVNYSKKTVEKFLKGKKVAQSRGNQFNVTDLDVLAAVINILMIHDPDDMSLIEKVMLSKNMPGDVKTQLLEKMYSLKKKKSIKIIKKNLKYYLKMHNDSDDPLSSEDARYLIRLIRFAGMMKDRPILKMLHDTMKKSKNEWIRFMCFYSLRKALGEDIYGDVIAGTKAQRSQVEKLFMERIKAVQ